MTAQPAEIKKSDLILRVALFVAIGWFGVRLFASLMFPVAGLLISSTLSTFAAGAIANVVCARCFAIGSMADFGLAWPKSPEGNLSWREFLLGWLYGAGAAVAVVGIPLVFRLAHFERAPDQVEHRWAALVFVSATLLFGAAGEEMLFHGYAFQLLVRSLGAFATILPVGIVFGVAHLDNENLTVPGIANTVAWGVLLGYAYWRRGALWLPIGLHFGWNVVLPLFGVNLSGFTIGVTGYRLHWSVGNLWSGGAYGPEGSLLTTCAVVALFWVVKPSSSDSESGGE
jgi:hypothetical protein